MPTASWTEWLERRGDLVAAGVIAFGVFALLLATINDYGMAWDEGFTVEREERVREWFTRVTSGPSAVPRAFAPSLSKLEPRSKYLRRAGSTADSPWSRESLRFYWPFAREEPNGHPPFYALLGLAGWAVSDRVLPPPGSYRVGPAALFAFTSGAVYVLMARRYGRLAALMSALGLSTMPRLFAHAHLASYDVPTLCLWFLAVASFLQSAEPPRPDAPDRGWAWTLAFGVAFGCAAATKLTGWFIPVPLAAWTVYYRDRRGARAMVLGGLVAAIVVYALIPTWWAEPNAGVRGFLRANLSRKELNPIPSLFLGKVYRFSLPWYNTAVITAIVVPPLTLALALVGACGVVPDRRHDRTGMLLFVCWAFFMVLRALPNAPGHDVERQFLAAFVFLACLSGIGVARAMTWVARGASTRLASAVGIALLLGSQAAAAWETWRYHPLQLSYYSPLIGGLTGAYRAGMEPTFYWDAVTPDVREWLNTHTPEGRTITFAHNTVSFEYLHHWGLLRPDSMARPRNPPYWFVVMNRPGHLRYFPRSIGQFLLDHSRPAFVKTLPFAPDVPLIAIYAGEEAYAAKMILERPVAHPQTRPAAED